MTKTGFYRDAEYMRKWRKKNRDSLNSYLKEWRGNNKDKIRSYQLKRLYKLSTEEYNAMWAEQGGRCLICNRGNRSLHVDHCHETDVVRGLLCGPCNRALGQFGDNLEGLLKAVDYLRKEYG